MLKLKRFSMVKVFTHLECTTQHRCKNVRKP